MKENLTRSGEQVSSQRGATFESTVAFCEALRGSRLTPEERREAEQVWRALTKRTD